MFPKLFLQVCENSILFVFQHVANTFIICLYNLIMWIFSRATQIDTFLLNHLSTHPSINSFYQ